MEFHLRTHVHQPDHQLHLYYVRKVRIYGPGITYENNRLQGYHLPMGGLDPQQ